MYAIGNRYPIDNAGQLKTAASYFDKYLTRFAPGDRAVIAHNLEKQASFLGVDLDMPWVTNYSRWAKKDAWYSPDFDHNMRMRKEACEVGKINITIDGTRMPAADMVTKLASNKDKMGPASMMAALEEFDKVAGLSSLYDHRMMDPVFTVYGSLSNPQYDARDVGGATDYQLCKIACQNKQMEKVASVVGKDWVDEFRKNPVDAFSKLKEPERIAVARAVGI